MKEVGLRSRVWKGAAWSLSGQSTNGILRILILIWLARLLSPSDFGAMTACLTVVEFSRIFMYMGLNPAIVQFPHLDVRHKSTGFIASLVFGIFVQLAIFISAPLIADFFKADQLAPMLRVLSFVFPIRGASLVSMALLQRELRFRELAKVDVYSYVIGFVPVTMVAALMGAGAWSLVLGYVVNIAVLAAFYLVLEPPKVTLKVDIAALRELLRYGSGITMARIAGYFSGSADNLVVGRMLGLTALGLYGRAYGLMSSAVKVAGGIVDRVLFAALSKVQNDPRRLKTGFFDSQVSIGLAMLPSSAFLVVLAPEVVYVLLGPQWTDSIPVLQILGAGLIFNAGRQMCSSVAKGTGAVFRIVVIQVIYSIAVVVGALVGQIWGIHGVAVGVLVAMIVGYITAARIALDITEMSWIDFARGHRAGMGAGVAVLICCLVVATISRRLDLPSIVVLVVSALVSLPVWLLCARHMIPGLLGKDGVQEIREFVDSRQTKIGKRIGRMTCRAIQISE